VLTKGKIAMLLDQFNILSEIEPPNGLTSADLFSAIDHLVKAVRILEECCAAISLFIPIRSTGNELNVRTGLGPRLCSSASISVIRGYDG
jgi:hypothetical protein